MFGGSKLENVARDAPLRLSVAAKLAFPGGSMTVSGLRREAARGRLHIERIAGQEFTTLNAIDNMRELCRLQPKARKPVNVETDRENSSSQLSPPARLLSRDDAASYCSLSTTAFFTCARVGRLPRSIPGTNRWDIKSIDHALDQLSGLELQTDTSPLDDWRSKRARQSERNS